MKSKLFLKSLSLVPLAATIPLVAVSCSDPNKESKSFSITVESNAENKTKGFYDLFLANEEFNKWLKSKDITLDNANKKIKNLELNFEFVTGVDGSANNNLKINSGWIIHHSLFQYDESKKETIKNDQHDGHLDFHVGDKAIIITVWCNLELNSK